jgi:C-terminal peptidase prc
MKKKYSLLIISLVAISSLACQFAYQLFAPPATPMPPVVTFVQVGTEIAPPTQSPPEPIATELLPTATSTPVLEVTVRPILTPISPHGTPEVSPTPISMRVQRRIFLEIWNTVNDYYLYADFNGADWDALRKMYGDKILQGMTNEEFYQAMDEMIFALGDDHSRYNTPAMVAADDAELSGQHNYVGIGVYISPVQDRGGAVVLATFPGSPAEGAGIKPRDVILTVDGEPVLDEEGYIKPIVRGPEGSSGLFEVQSPGEDVREVVIIRKRITGEMRLPYTILTTPQGKRIGYIFLIGFMDITFVDQVADALREMNSAGPLDGLIIDNRENGGGSSNVLEPIMGYFTKGLVGNFVSRTENRSLNLTNTKDILGSQDIPLVILVGRGTVSFGEIFSGALRDLGRAHLIGTTTGGNIETLWGFDFEDGSLLWLAVETFRPLNHPEENWEESGIIPDETVEGNWEEAGLDNDSPVQAALRYFDSR